MSNSCAPWFKICQPFSLKLYQQVVSSSQENLFLSLANSCRISSLLDPKSVNLFPFSLKVYQLVVSLSSQEEPFPVLGYSCQIPALLDPKSVNLMSVKVSQFPHSYPLCYLIFITPLSVVVSGLMIIVDTVWLFSSSMDGCRGLAFDSMINSIFHEGNTNNFTWIFKKCLSIFFFFFFITCYFFFE